jgi:hypothetical protein
MCFMGIPTLHSTKVSYIYFQLTAYNLTRNDLKKKEKNERNIMRVYATVTTSKITKKAFFFYINSRHPHASNGSSTLSNISAIVLSLCVKSVVCTAGTESADLPDTVYLLC